MHTFRGRLIGKKFLAPTILLVRLAPDAPFDFRAGQYVMVGIPLSDGTSVERPFSIASPPHASNELEFLVQMKAGSAVPEFFRRAQRGAFVVLRGPLGGTLQLPKRRRPLHFLAAGCGIAPFRAMMKDLFSRDPNASVRLSFLREPVVWGVIDDELAQWYRTCQNFSYSIIHMRTDEALKPEWQWRHVDLGEPLHGEFVFLAGGSGFIVGLKNHLLERGFNSTHIITEGT